MSDETRWKLLHGDSRDVLPTLEADTLDACCCDPPYEIGFMSAQWDRTGIAYDPTFWQSVLRALKPGAFLCAFGGTRTSHRIACAIEDAGFEIRDTILSAGALAWIHGQGFPKREDQLKPSFEPILLARKPLSERSIEANVERWGTGSLQTEACRVGTDETIRDFGTPMKSVGGLMNHTERSDRPYQQHPAGRAAPNVVLVHSPACQRRSWGQPSLLEAEAMTPNGHADDGTKLQHSRAKRQFGYRDAPEEWDCAEGCAVRELSRQSGILSIGSARGVYERKDSNIYGSGWAPTTIDRAGETRTAARFFPQFAYDEADAEFWPWRYCAKASRSEREAGLEDIEVLSLSIQRPLKGKDEWEQEAFKVVLRVDTAPSRQKVIDVSGTPNNAVSEWNTLLFGNGPSDPSLMDSNCITLTTISSITESKTLRSLTRSLTKGCIADVNCGTANGGSLAGNAENAGPSLSFINVRPVSLPGARTVASGTLWTIRGNVGSPANHPTVKPQALIAWLCRLTCPPGGTVLDPFLGSGTTAVACLTEGFKFVGIEREEEYLNIAKARLQRQLPFLFEEG